MRPTILATTLLTLLSLNSPARALPPSHLWSHSYGDANPQGGISVTTDAFGNVYMTGSFYGTVDFGGGSLISAGGADIFLVKFSSAGFYQWGQRFGDASDQNCRSVAVDAADNVYIGGFFQGSVDFGGGSLASLGDRDIYIAKFNSSGAYQWSKRFGDANEQWCMSMDVDDAGYVYLTGYFLGTVNFGGANLSSTGSYQVFLASLDSDGVHEWSKQFGDAADQRGTSVTADAYGDVYMTGILTGTANFGGANLTGAGGFDIFLAKFDALGVHQWSKRFGDAANQDPHAVMTDHWGCVYLTGGIAGTTDFGGGGLISAGSYDAFLAKFDASGAHEWSHIWGDAAIQSGGSIATTSLGDVFLGGTLEGTINLGGGNLTSLGGSDFYLAKFDVSGVHQWSQRYGDSTKYQFVNGVATDGADDLYATGSFQGTVDFGGGPLTAAGSGEDAFLVKLGTALTGVHDSPTSDVLSISSYPNPFNPAATIRYTVPSKGRVTIDVFDARGAHVALLRDENMDAGTYAARWNGRDDRGVPAGSGVYFARLTSAEGTRSYKMTLLK